MLLETDFLWNGQVGLKQEGRAEGRGGQRGREERREGRGKGREGKGGEGRGEGSYLADTFFFRFSQLLLFSREFSFTPAAVPGRWPP